MWTDKRISSLDLKGGVRVSYIEESGIQVCGEPLPEVGKGCSCSDTALAPNGRCRTHGGKFGKSGYEQVLSGGLLSGYIEGLADPDTIYDMDEPLAVLKAVTARLVDRLNELDTPDFRKAMQARIRDFENAVNEGDAEASAKALQNLKRLADRGSSEDAALRELQGAMREFMRRQEGAWNIRLGKQNAINVRELTGILAELMRAMATDVRRAETQLGVILRKELGGKESRRIVALLQEGGVVGATLTSKMVKSADVVMYGVDGS